jgi:hypothetical protein
MRRLGCCLAALILMTVPALAQEADDEEVDLRAVWFTSYDCPETDDVGPGSRVAPLELSDFDEAYYASAIDSDAEAPGEAHARYHCKWVRLTGFMTWMDYYHYRGVLREDFSATYFASDAARYILERFANGSPPRAALAQRRLTLVARFYNLCFAAEEARRAAGDEFWWLFGPCHYGANEGMMLTDVHIETIHDPAPVYLLGDMNRAALGFSPRVEEGPARTAMEAEVRDWAAALRRGVEAYADAVIARRTYLASESEERRRSTRANILSADSYASYLSTDPRFRRLNLRRAQVELFWDGDGRDRAHGCICLERACADRWPLFRGDADEFLGAAACIALEREESGAWRW